MLSWDAGGRLVAPADVMVQLPPETVKELLTSMSPRVVPMVRLLLALMELRMQISQPPEVVPPLPPPVPNTDASACAAIECVLPEADPRRLAK